MEAKEKILKLIAAEDENLAALLVKRRAHACRVESFRDALAAINGDTQSSITIAKAQIQSKIAAEEIAIRKTDLKMTYAETRKSALEETASIFKSSPPPPRPPSIKMPERRPSFIFPNATTQNDSSHKELREGSDIFRVREFLRKAGAPALLSDIVKFLFPGDENDVKQGKYANLRGTLTGYANEGRFFTIESKSPHVIGLIEFKK